MSISGDDLEFLDGLPHGYCLIDEQYTILSWNRSLEEWSGTLRSEMIGQNLRVLQPKLCSPEYKMRFDLVFSSGTPFVFSPLIHKQIIPCGDSELHQVHRTYLTKYKSSAGNIALLVVENVTRSHESMVRYREVTNELENSKQEVIANAKQLAVLNDELSQFAYRTSHDLKSPVTTSKGLLGIVLEDMDDGQLVCAKANVNKVVKVLGSLETLIVDIFSLVKADLSMDCEQSFVIDTVYEDIESRLTPLAEENSCNLDFSGNLSGKVNVQRVRLTQIIENIVSNGIKYRDPEKDSSFVRVVAEQDSGSLCLHIEDNGIGIPEKYQADVFTVFKRFNPECGAGSGLGMAIVKKHVDYLNGQISFSSDKNGTRFDVRLPHNSRSLITG